MTGYVFAVDETPFCVWEDDLSARNVRFLVSMDGEYFDYLSERFLDDLDSDNALRASMALRTTYHHALETMFSLMGAMTQAPDAVPAWLPKCRTEDLHNVVQKLADGVPVLTQRGRQRVRFEDLAQIVHAHCWPDETPAHETQRRFAETWMRLARDFRDTHRTSEYNSIKHGLRLAAGGFVLRIGREETYGVRAPEANMRTMGASRWGTSFYLPEKLAEAPTGSSHHFRIRSLALNWSVEATVQRLQLVAMSINNLLSTLRILNGAAPAEQKYVRPLEPAAFEHPWTWQVGVSSSNMDVTQSAAGRTLRPRTELLAELEQRGSDAA